MSIATEITRLQNAKASIKTSIENKGVTVPSATKLDGYSTLIDSIQTGGGGISVDGIAQNLEPNGAIVLGDSVTTVGSYAFIGKSGITSIVGNEVTTFGGYCFSRCGSLASVSLPKLKTLYQYAFEHCTSLVTLHLPSAKSLNTYNFQESGIKTLVLPKFDTATGWQLFRYMRVVEKIDMLGSSTISQQAFESDALLNTIIIRRSSVPSLANINAFNNSPFASGKSGGTLYVPSSLISSYQSATNWSTILGYANNQIKSIESTHTDPSAPIDLTLYYADGTPIGA